MKIHCSFFILI